MLTVTRGHTGISMEVKVIDILDSVVLVEYEDSENLLQRKYISREVLPTFIKNVTLEFDGRSLQSGIEYSDVDLVEFFGESYLDHPVKDIQEAMKKYGLWTRAEYLKYPERIAYVLKQFPGIDVQTVQNATYRRV